MAKTKNALLWQSELHRLSQYSKKAGGRRAKRFDIKIGRLLSLAISLRSFKTKKRAQDKKQLVITLPQLFDWSLKEIAISVKSRQKIQLPALALPKPALLVVACLIGVGYFGTHLTSAARLDVSSPTKSAVKTVNSQSAVKTMSRSLPTQLRIPKIDIDTQISQIAKKTDGTLDVPNDYHMAGWYSNSPTPGELGPAIIDGHVDNVAGIGVFWRLRELTPGDIIEVTRADSSVARFKIDAIQQYPQDSFPSNEVYGKINYAGIRLITCGGVFNQASGHYSDNIVVFGSLI